MILIIVIVILVILIGYIAYNHGSVRIIKKVLYIGKDGDILDDDSKDEIIFRIVIYDEGDIELEGGFVFKETAFRLNPFTVVDGKIFEGKKEGDVFYTEYALF